MLNIAVCTQICQKYVDMKTFVCYPVFGEGFSQDMEPGHRDRQWGQTLMLGHKAHSQRCHMQACSSPNWGTHFFKDLNLFTGAFSCSNGKMSSNCCHGVTHNLMASENCEGHFSLLSDVSKMYEKITCNPMWCHAKITQEVQCCPRTFGHIF